MNKNLIVRVGIGNTAIHVPRLYLDMRDFANLQGADCDNLNDELVLQAIANPDMDEKQDYDG